MFSYGKVLVSSLKTKEESLKMFHESVYSKKNQKKEVFDFYIDLLRKLELVKFSIKNKNLKENEMRKIIFMNLIGIFIGRFQCRNREYEIY